MMDKTKLRDTLEEEIVYLKEINNGLDYCVEQSKKENQKNKEIVERLKKLHNLNSLDYKTKSMEILGDE